MHPTGLNHMVISFHWSPTCCAPGVYRKHEKLCLGQPNKLFYSFWITPRRGQVLSVSTRHRPVDLWALAGALTSHIGLHFLRFSDIFNGGRDREDRSLASFGDMVPWFPKNSQNECFYCTPMENFLTGFFCYLTFSMLDNTSYAGVTQSV